MIYVNKNIFSFYKTELKKCDYILCTGLYDHEMNKLDFYENLLDADVASNLLSWRWVTGLQTLGKKYIATEPNINKYTNNRYLGFKLPKIKNIIKTFLRAILQKE